MPRTFAAAMVTTVAAAHATAAPTVGGLPDLDAADQLAASVDVVGAPADSYFDGESSVVVDAAAAYRIADAGAVTLSMPLVLFLGDAGHDRLAIGDVTLAAQLARRVRSDLVVGGGGAWTAPTTTFDAAATMAGQLAGDSYRYFTAGHVAHLHGDVRWRVGLLTVQLQAGIEDYLMADWPDQLLVRIGGAATVRLGRADAYVAGVILTDALDEQYDEGADAVGAIGVGVRGPVHGHPLGVHVTAHLGNPDPLTPSTVWSLGLDGTFPVGW